LRRVVLPRITPELPAKDLLGLLAGTDEVDAWNRARRWFGERTTDQIVAELVPAAAEATTAERVMAVGLISGLGNDAAAAMSASELVPNLAAHARLVAYQHELAPSPGTEDLVWLATEYAHADLAGHGIPLQDRVVALLILLYAQPLIKIARLTTGDVELDGEVRLRLGGEPVPIIPPFSDVLLDHIATRSNRTTATNRTSTLLFPGRRAGQPIRPGSLRPRLHRLGIPNLDGRTRAIRDLLQQAPPAVIASMLGYCPTAVDAPGACSTMLWSRRSRRLRTTTARYVMAYWTDFQPRGRWQHILIVPIGRQFFFSSSASITMMPLGPRT
jgi:hypothetical protein